MFTNHNISKSLLGDVSSFWVDNKHNYNLPQEFIEAAKVASIEYRKAINLEDRKNVVLAHLDETVKKTGTESNAHYMVNEFERAVAGFANDISNVEITNTDDNEEIVLSEGKGNTLPSERDNKTSPKASKKIDSANTSNSIKRQIAAAKRQNRQNGTSDERNASNRDRQGEVVNAAGQTVSRIVPSGVAALNNPPQQGAKTLAPVWDANKADTKADKKSNLKSQRDAARARDAQKAIEASKAAGGLGNRKTDTASYDPLLDQEVELYSELTSHLLNMSDVDLNEFLDTIDDEDAQNLQEWVDWVNTEIDKYENQMKLEEHLSSLSEEQFGELLEQLTEDQVNTLLAMLEINTECDDGPNDDEETNEQEEVERQ